VQDDLPAVDLGVVGGQVHVDAHHAFGVFLEVCAYARQVPDDLDAGVAQLLRRPDPGQHQQPGRCDRAGAENHFAAGFGAMQPAAPSILHARAAAVLEQQPPAHAVRADGEIPAPAHGLQIGPRCVVAAAALLVHFRVGHAFLGEAVVVVVERQSRLDGGLHEGVRERMGRAQRRGADRTRAAPVAVVSERRGFHAPEKRQHVGVTPSGAALRNPAVEIVVRAAHVQHAVDRAAAAQGPAGRPQVHAVVAAGVGLGLVAPVQPGIADGADDRRRHPDIERAVDASCLEQQHPRIRILRQAVGHGAACRTGAHDDVVPGTDGENPRT